MDADAAPAPDVAVRADVPLRDGAQLDPTATKATTDGKGTAVLTLAPPISVSELRVSAGPSGAAAIAIERIRPELSVRLVLPRPATIRGRIVTVGLGAAPPSDLLIAARPEALPEALRHRWSDHEPLAPLPVRPSLDGTFEVSNVLLGASYELNVVSGEWIVPCEPPSTRHAIRAIGGSDDVQIRIQRIGFLALQLVDESSRKPVAAAIPDATILTKDPTSGRQIEARHPFSIALPDGNTIRGPTSPEALGWVLIPVPLSGEEDRPTADGGSSLPSCDVYVDVPGYLTTTTSAPIRTLSSIRKDAVVSEIRLTPESDATAGRCSLTALEDWGDAAPLGRASLLLVLDRHGRPPIVRTGANSGVGAWIFFGLPSGAYSARLVDGFGLESRPMDVRLSPDHKATARFDYEGVTAVRLVFFDAHGVSIFEPTVVLSASAQPTKMLLPEQLTPAIDHDGVLRTPWIPVAPGRLRVVAEKPGVGSGEAEVDVQQGRITEIRVDLVRSLPLRSAPPGTPK